MFLVVILHSAAPYMQVPLRGLIMPIQEGSALRLPDTVFWFLRACSLPMFFLVSGCLTRESLSRAEPDAFLRSRWKKIGLPLLIGYPIVTLIIHPIWLWGWVTRGWASWGHLFSFKFGPELQRAVWGLHHFWFLEYLLLYSVIVWALARMFRRPPTASIPSTNAHVVRSREIALGSQSETFTPPPKKPPGVWRLIPLMVGLVALSAWFFSADASWYLDFHDLYYPEPLCFAYYALYFCLGLCLRREWLRGIGLLAPIFLLIATACLAPMLGVIASSVWETDHGPRQGRLLESSSTRMYLGTLVASVGVCSALGFIGLATFVRPGRRRAAVFLSDASYWVFLTHVPWIGMAVMAQRAIPLVPELKMWITAAFTIALSLATFVPLRRTTLGRWLGATAPAPGYSP